jgi:hypothetical protein
MDTTSNLSTKGSSHTILESARKIRLEKQKKREARTRDKLAEFMSADIQDSELGIVPEGYGGIFYLTVLLFVPWIIGTIFMFLYVAKGQMNTFGSLDTSILLTWVIGYEILAVLILLLIFKKAISYVLS